VHLSQPIVLPFVVIDAGRSPFFVCTQPRRSKNLQQPAVGSKGSHVFTFVGIPAGSDRPAVKNLRKVRAAISRVHDSRCRATRPATHHCNCVMTGEVDAFFLKLLADARAKHARHPMTAQIQRRGLTGMDVRRVAFKARRLPLLRHERRMNGTNEDNYEKDAVQCYGHRSKYLASGALPEFTSGCDGSYLKRRTAIRWSYIPLAPRVPEESPSFAAQ